MRWENLPHDGKLDSLEVGAGILSTHQMVWAGTLSHQMVGAGTLNQMVGAGTLSHQMAYGTCKLPCKWSGASFSICSRKFPSRKMWSSQNGLYNNHNFLTRLAAFLKFRLKKYTKSHIACKVCKTKKNTSVYMDVLPEETPWSTRVTSVVSTKKIKCYRTTIWRKGREEFCKGLL